MYSVYRVLRYVSMHSSLLRRLANYKVCLCFIVLSVTVCTVGYVCLFHGDQICVFCWLLIHDIIISTCSCRYCNNSLVFGNIEPWCYLEFELKYHFWRPELNLLHNNNYFKQIAVADLSILLLMTFKFYYNSDSIHCHDTLLCHRDSG